MELGTYDDDFTDRGNLSVHGTGYVNNTANSRFGHQEFTVHGKTTTSTANFTKESISTGLVSKIVGYTAAISGGNTVVNRSGNYQEKSLHQRTHCGECVLGLEY